MEGYAKCSEDGSAKLGTKHICMKCMDGSASFANSSAEGVKGLAECVVGSAQGCSGGSLVLPPLQIKHCDV